MPGNCGTGGVATSGVVTVSDASSTRKTVGPVALVWPSKLMRIVWPA
ncbi:MAG: hypothetical protein QM770_03615 [Tepidisphaeraceae bacterium]